jgi:hypothetical protein
MSVEGYNVGFSGKRLFLHVVHRMIAPHRQPAELVHYVIRKYESVRTSRNGKEKIFIIIYISYCGVIVNYSTCT